MAHPDRNPDVDPAKSIETGVRWPISEPMASDENWLAYRAWVERFILRGMLTERAQMLAEGIALGYEKGRNDGAQMPEAMSYAAAAVSPEERDAYSATYSNVVLEWKPEHGYYEQMLTAGTLESAKKVADSLNASAA